MFGAFPHTVKLWIFHDSRIRLFWPSSRRGWCSSRGGLSSQFSHGSFLKPAGSLVHAPDPFRYARFWRSWTLRGSDWLCSAWFAPTDQFFPIGFFWACSRGERPSFPVPRWIGWSRWKSTCSYWFKSRKCFLSALIWSQSGSSPRSRTCHSAKSVTRWSFSSPRFVLFPLVLGLFGPCGRSR